MFLDRDGVLIPDTGYPSEPERIALLPGVGAALRRLRAAGWRLVVVTNQAGIARGKFSAERLDAVHARLRELLTAEGVALDALYFCPHHREGHVEPYNVNCEHRKPAPGMLLSAAADLKLRLADCWLIGDNDSDVAAAHAAGCRAIHLGCGPTAAEAQVREPEQAADVILGEGAGHFFNTPSR